METGPWWLTKDQKLSPTLSLCIGGEKEETPVPAKI